MQYILVADTDELAQRKIQKIISEIIASTEVPESTPHPWNLIPLKDSKPAFRLPASLSSTTPVLILVPKGAAPNGLEKKSLGCHEKLSDREKDIFRMIALGSSVKAIAAELKLSDKTVATYLGRIREKTGLNTYVDIARYALKNNIVE